MHRPLGAMHQEKVWISSRGWEPKSKEWRHFCDKYIDIWRYHFKQTVLRAPWTDFNNFWICFRSRKFPSARALRWCHSATINLENTLSSNANQDYPCVFYLIFKWTVLRAQEFFFAHLWICFRSRQPPSVRTLWWCHGATINLEKCSVATQIKIIIL